MLGQIAKLLSSNFAKYPSAKLDIHNLLKSDGGFHNHGELIESDEEFSLSQELNCVNVAKAHW